MNHKRDFYIYLILFSQNPQPTEAKLRMYFLYKNLLPSLTTSIPTDLPTLVSFTPLWFFLEQELSLIHLCIFIV